MFFRNPAGGESDYQMAVQGDGAQWQQKPSKTSKPEQYISKPTRPQDIYLRKHPTYEHTS